MASAAREHSFLWAALLTLCVTGLVVTSGGYAPEAGPGEDVPETGPGEDVPVVAGSEPTSTEEVPGEGEPEVEFAGVSGEPEHVPPFATAEAPAEEDAGPAPVVSRGTRNGTGANDTRVPTDERSLEYLIITPQVFKKTLNDLAKWKTKKGVTARIVTVEECQTAHPEGPDLAASIQATIRDEKEADGNLTWVLLAGDSEFIPERYVFARYAKKAPYVTLQNYVVSDLYYAGLNGSWDLDNDTIYGEKGEEDYQADVYVGRLPVGNGAEATRAVKNILAYEREPPEGDWFDSALMAGALMAVPNVIDDPKTGEDEGYTWYKDNAWEAVNDTLPHLPPTLDTTVLYDYNQRWGGNYSVLNDTLYDESFLNAFDDGHSMVNTISHGFSDGDALAEYAGTGDVEYFRSFFGYEHAEELENGDMLPLMYMSSCDAANFSETDDTGLERLLYASGGGVIGLVGGSTTTYRGEFKQNDSSFGNWWMNQRFFEAMYGEGRTRPGENLYRLKWEYQDRIADDSNPNKNYSFKQIYRINTLAYNLLGDPEVDIYTSAPGELNVTFISPPHVDGGNISITVIDNETWEPVPGARVTMRYQGAGDGSVFHASGYTDDGGVLLKNVTFVDQASYTLTVTAHNYLPSVTRVPISIRSDLSFPGDDGGGGGSGGGEGGGGAPPQAIELVSGPGTSLDGGFLAGTNISINITVLNSGGIDLEGWELGVYLVPGIYDAEAALGDLAPGVAPVELMGAGSVEIPGSPFNLSLLSSGGTVNVSAGFGFTNGTWTLVGLLDPRDLVRETDERNNAASRVLFENAPPAVTAVPDMVMDEDSDGRTLDLAKYTYDDLRPDDLIYEIWDVNDPGFQFEPGGPGVQLDLLEDATVRAVPEADWFGEKELEVRVSDGLSNAAEWFRVVVNPVNDPPVLEDPGRLDVQEGDVVRLQLNATDVDNDPSELRYYSNSTEFAVDELTGLLEFVPDDGDVGRIYLNFSVTDGEAWDNQYGLIRVENVNEGPELTWAAGGAYEGATLTTTVGTTMLFQFSAEDPDAGDELRYHLEFENETDVYRRSSRDGDFSYMPTEGHVGTHALRVSVVDAVGLEDGYVFYLTVEEADVIDTDGDGEDPQAEGGARYILLAVFAIVFVMVLMGSLYNVRRARGPLLEPEVVGGDMAREEAGWGDECEVDGGGEDAGGAGGGKDGGDWDGEDAEGAGDREGTGKDGKRDEDKGVDDRGVDDVEGGGEGGEKPAPPSRKKAPLKVRPKKN